MMLSRIFASIFKVFLAGLLLASVSAWAGKGRPAAAEAAARPRGIRAGEDTSYAIEKEYSCLTGGCHETNTHPERPSTATH